MRKFAFVIFDEENKITQRFPIELATDPSGLGFKLNLSTIEGDIVDTITQVSQEKQSISLTINFPQNGYEKYILLSQWLQKYSKADSRMALEYNDGAQVLYIEGKITELKKTEKDEYSLLSCSATFTPITPFFLNIENAIKIKVSTVGKSYPFKYPYCYGKNRVENNIIDNPYISDIPVTVKIEGKINEPTIYLLDENGEEYSRVQFTGKNLKEGQYIIVNSSSHKIYFFDGNTLKDYSAETDPKYDTFLIAQSGISKIFANIGVNDTAELTGSWRQYKL